MRESTQCNPHYRPVNLFQREAFRNYRDFQIQIERRQWINPKTNFKISLRIDTKPSSMDKSFV